MLGHTPSAPPRCKSPRWLRPFMFMTFTCTGDMTGSLPINLLPVLVTFQALSNKHNCLFDSVTYVAWLCHVCDMTGSSLNNIIVSLCICHLTDMALSHVWHNTVTFVTCSQRRWQCLSSSTELYHVYLCADSNKLVSRGNRHFQTGVQDSWVHSIIYCYST